MSLLQPRNPFKPHWRVWNALSLFSDRTLYIRYLRRQFFLSPSFITSRFFLEDRIVDLNFFLLLLFQSFSLNKTARLSQIIYFWAFCLREITLSSSMPGAYVRIIPNTQRTYLGSRRTAVPKSFSKESSFV